jgi:6-phosphogluconolactonase
MTYLITSYNNLNILAHNVKGRQSQYDFSIIDKNQITHHNLNTVNPAFVLKHPDDNILYLCHESIYDGTLSSIRYDNNLELIDSVSSFGKSSCYLELTLDRTHIININYWDSSITIHPLKNNIISSTPPKLYNPITPNKIVHKDDHLKDRQSTSHHHSCVFYQDSLYVPDLGKDRIDIYKFINNGLIYNGYMMLPAGSGPRYGVIKKNLMYIVNEISSTVAVILLDNMKILQIISTIPKNSKNNTCSGIKLHNGYIYVSNRGHNSIALFKITLNGTLKLCEIVSSHGKTPRNFIINKKGDQLLVANQDSNNISIFDIMEDKIVFKEKLECDSPNYIVEL